MAVRGHNAGNIRYNPADKWQGAATPPNIGAFCAFVSPVWGIRAIARVLITFQDKHDCHTIRDFISRYAPPADMNPTEKYIDNVAEWSTYDENETLDVHTYEHCAPIVAAIIRQEQGSQPYSQAQIDDGLKLAGIVKRAAASTLAAVAQDPVARIAAAGTALAGVQGAISSVADIWDTLAQRIDPRFLIAATIVVLAGILAWRVYDRVRARSEGRA